LFVCKCVLLQGDNPIAVNKYIILYNTCIPNSFTIFTLLDIWLAVHHCITFLLLPTWYINFLFIYTNYIKLNSSICFERNPAIIRRSTTQIVHMQPLVSSLFASDCLVQPWLHKTVTCREWRYQRLHMQNMRRRPDDGWIALETYRGI
jgi:hypothetical protein